MTVVDCEGIEVPVDLTMLGREVSKPSFLFDMSTPSSYNFSWISPLVSTLWAKYTTGTGSTSF